MEELLTLEMFFSKNRKLILCWNQRKVNLFRKKHGVENVIICFGYHQKMTQGLLKILFSGRAKRTKKSAGIYDHLTQTIVIFLDNIVIEILKGCSAKESDQMFEKTKQELPKVVARILSHELGHATEKIDFQKMAEEIIKDRRIRVPLLRTILIKRIIKKRKANSEKIAEEFAKQYAQELESFFAVKEL